MKLVKLTMTAFGIFADCTELDFTAMDATVFLVIGGRTTIVRAILFALYGCLGDSAIPLSELHCRQAPLGQDAIVSLMFEHDGAIHTVTRSLHLLRQRSGELDVPTRYRVCAEYRKEGEESVSMPPLKLDEKIRRLLGLDVDHFLQLVCWLPKRALHFWMDRPTQRASVLLNLFRQDECNAICQRLQVVRRRFEDEKRQVEVGQASFFGVQQREFEHVREFAPLARDEGGRLCGPRRSDYIEKTGKVVASARAKASCAQDRYRQQKAALAETTVGNLDEACLDALLDARSEVRVTMQRVQELARAQAVGLALIDSFDANQQTVEKLDRFDSVLREAERIQFDFTNFVHRQCLEHVLCKANRYLDLIMGEKYELRVSDDLEIELWDRLTETPWKLQVLGSWESAMVSLALQLALLGQSGTGLQTLLICDDMATLGQEAIDRFLDVLELVSLQNLEAQVGIFSHAYRYEDRLRSQIRIAKGAMELYV